MKRTLLVLLVIFLSVSATYGQNASLFDKYSKLEGVYSQTVGKGVLKLALLSSKGNEKALLKCISQIKILDFTNSEQKIRNLYLYDVQKLEGKDFVKVAEETKDNSTQLCYARVSKDTIERLLIINIESQTAQIMSMEMEGTIPVNILEGFMDKR